MSKTSADGNPKSQPVVVDELDLVEEMLKKTGCADHNYALHECMFEHRDWRKCQEKVQALKVCMDAFNRVKKPSTSSSSTGT